MVNRRAWLKMALSAMILFAVKELSLCAVCIIVHSVPWKCIGVWTML